MDDWEKAWLDQNIYQDAEFYDEVSGKELPKQLTIDARKAEMQQVKFHNMYPVLWQGIGASPNAVSVFVCITFPTVAEVRVF